MMRIAGTFTLVLLLLTLSVSAFDGNRDGFVLGVGLGYAPVLRNTTDSTTQDKSGLALNILIGHGWGGRNMIAYQIHGAVYKESSTSAFRTKYTVVQGFSGPSYYRYVDVSGVTFYLNAGLGFQYYYRMNFDAFGSYTGFGALLGLGVEISRPYDMYVSLSHGKSNNSYGNKARKHTQLALTITGMWY
jgi:hypothetical protein